MTSKLIVNSLAADTGVSTITFADQAKMGNSLFHSTGFTIGDSFLHSTGVNLTNINATGVITATKFVGEVSVGSSITFEDNEKAYFGTGTDFSIYHNGSASYLDETGTGGLIAKTNTAFQVFNSAGSQPAFTVTPGGSVDLYHNTTKVLETKSYGIDLADDIAHVGDSNTKFGFGGGDDTFRVITGGSTRLHIHTDGRFRVGCTAQPSGTVGGFQLDMGSYPGTLRLMSGAGASGTDSASLAVGGSNYHANLHNGANMGGKLDLYNYNSTDGNSTAVSFYNSNGLSIARILGVNISHSSRNGALVFMTSNAQYPTEKMRLDKDGNITFGVTDTPTAITSAAIKYISGGRDYWNSTKGDYRALRLRVYDNGGNIDDQYGVGVSSGELELQSQQDIGFYAGSAGSTTGRRVLRFRLDQSAGSLDFETNTKLYLKGTANNPQRHASINIGSYGNASETRAIDMWGSWGAGENKSISFNHGANTSNLVGQINCIHNGPGSSLRWGKLYHSGDSNTYTMTLDSTSTTGANLSLYNGNLKVASGHGIDFSAASNVGGMTSELLDDYEEGSFSPTLVNGNNGYRFQQGTYTKVGNLVTFTAYIETSATPPSGNLAFGGLPFTSIGSRSWVFPFHTNRTSFGTASFDARAYLGGTDTNVYIYYPVNSSSSNFQPINQNGMNAANASAVWISGSYQTSS